MISLHPLPPCILLGNFPHYLAQASYAGDDPELNMSFKEVSCPPTVPHQPTTFPPTHSYTHTHTHTTPFCGVTYRGTILEII